MNKIFFALILLFFWGCLNAPQPHKNFVKKYFILDRQGDKFVLTEKCHVLSELSFDDSIFTMEKSYQVSGTCWYQIAKIDSSRKQKIILSNSEIVNVGHFDSTVRVKIYYDDINYKLTRFTIHKKSWETTIDTIYATKPQYKRDYKIYTYACSVKGG
jgi:hypothetical protein